MTMSERPIGWMRVCVRLSPAAAPVLTARAEGCLSSSCARFIRSTLTVAVEDRRIRLAGDLIHRSGEGRDTCTSDCGGARTVELPLPPLEAGAYTIHYGNGAPVAIDVAAGAGERCVTLRK